MKAVLISIQPKWCELIASGKKTVEVRKTKPKLETPFKVYIYGVNQRLVLLIPMELPIGCPFLLARGFLEKFQKSQIRQIV